MPRGHHREQTSIKVRRAEEKHGLNYEEWSNEELNAKAREMHIHGRSRMSRDELISALRQH